MSIGRILAGIGTASVHLWRVARVVAFTVLASTTCRDATGLDPAAVVLEIAGPTSVRVAERIELIASVPGADDLGPGVVRWRVADTSRVSLDSIGPRTNVLGRRPGRTSVEAVLFAPDLPTQVVATREIIVDPGLPAQLLIVQGPGDSARAGIPLQVGPTVQLADIGGNAVPSAGFAVTAEIATGTGTLSGAIAVTNASGLATFGSLSLSGRTGAYRLRFTGVGSLTPDTSAVIQLYPGEPNRVAITQEPAGSAAAGVALDQQPAVQLRDVADNDVPEAGHWVRAQVRSCATCVIESDSAQTNAQGRATFTALRFGGPVGPYSLLFSGTIGTTMPGTDTSTVITLGPGVPASLGFERRPAGRARVGVPLDTQPRLLLRDAYGNTVPSANRVVTATTTPGAALSGATATTDVSGVATFSSLALTGTSGAYELRFSSTALADTSAGSVTLGYGPAAALRFDTEPLAASAGSSLGDVRVRVEDAGGNIVVSHSSAINVTLSTATSGATLSGLTSALPANGITRFQDLSVNRAAVDYRLRATSDALEALSSTFDIAPGARAGLSILVQPSIAAVAGAVLGSQPRVQLVDAFGNAVADSGVVVTATVAGGAGTVANGTATTNAAGIAAFNGLSIGALVGARRLELSAGGVASALTNAVNLSAGPPNALRLTVQPSATAASGGVLVQQPVVRVEDAYGNPVAASGLTVTAELVGGAGLAGTLGLPTDANGIAAYTDLALSSVNGAYQLRFVAPGLQPTVSTNVQVTSGTATRLRFTAQPASFVAGATTGQPVVVAVEDAQGNPVSSATASVSVALANNPRSATLSGGTPVDAVAGLAAFVNLNVTIAGSGYILVASAPGLQSATSQPFDVAAAPAERLALLTAPASTAESGVPLLTQPVLALQDAYGNRVRSAGVDVTVSTAGASVIGAATVRTDTAGRAAYAGIALAGVAGASYPLQFAAAGLQGVSSSPISLSAGRPARLAFRRQPSNVTAGAPIAPSVEVVLQDLSGNLVTESGRDIALAVESGPPGAILSGTTTVSTVAGVSDFTDVRLIQQGGGYTLRASADSLTAQVSATFDVLAANASRLSVATQPPATATSAALLASAIVVRLRDELGNNVATSDVPVTVSVSSGVAALSGTLVVNTDATGAATFSTLTLSGTPETVVLSFSAPAILPVSTNSISLLPGAPASLAFESQPAEVTAGVEASPSWIVRLRDAAGFPLATGAVPVTVALEDSTGQATLLGTSTRSTTSGTATFADLTIQRAGRRYRLLATATGLAAAESDTFRVLASDPASVAAASSTSQLAVVATAVPESPAVRVLDGFGNPVPDVEVQFAAASGGGTVGNAVPRTDSSGVARAGGWTLGQVAGLQSVNATPVVAGTITGAPVRFDATATPGQASAATSTVLVAAGEDSIVTAGDSLQVVVTVRDAYGNRVAGGGDTVVLSRLSGTSTGTLSAVSDSLNGAYTGYFRALLVGTPSLVSASVNGEALGTAAIPVTVVPGPPDHFDLVAGGGQSATRGTAVAVSPAVVLRDIAGNALGGVAVTAEDLTGGAIVSVDSPQTDGDGRFTVTRLVLGVIATDYTLRFSAGAASASIVATARGVTGGGSITLQPQASLVQPLAIRVGSVSGDFYVLNSDSTVVRMDAAGSVVSSTRLVETRPRFSSLENHFEVLEAQGVFALGDPLGYVWAHRMSDGVRIGVFTSSSADGVQWMTASPGRGRTYTTGGSATSGDITSNEFAIVNGAPARTGGAVQRQTPIVLGFVVDTVADVVLSMERCGAPLDAGCEIARWSGAGLGRVGGTALPATALVGGGDTPVPIAVDHLTGRVFVKALGALLVVDSRNDEVSAQIPFSVDPALEGTSALATHTARRELFALNAGDQQVLILDLDTYAVRGRISLPVVPQQIAVGAGNTMAVLDRDMGAVALVDLASRSVATTRSQCCSSGMVAFDSARDAILVASDRQLGLVDAGSFAPLGAIATSVLARQLLVTPNGQYAIIRGDSARVSIVDLALRREVRVLNAACRVSGVALSQSGAQLWVTSADSCDGTGRTEFASASSGFSTLATFPPGAGGTYSGWQVVGVRGEDPVFFTGSQLVGLTYPNAEQFLVGAPVQMSGGATVTGVFADSVSGGLYSLASWTSTIGYLGFFAPGSTMGQLTTISSTRGGVLSGQTRTFVVATSSDILVWSRDRQAIVQSIAVTGGATSVTFDEGRRRAYYVTGDQLRVLNF